MTHLFTLAALLLASLSREITGGTLTVNGNATNLICAGALDAANVHVTGTTSLLQVTQGIKNNATVSLDGQVTTALLYGKLSEASLFAA